jgi:nucleoside-diphosphate-sugar epimerase
MRSLVTGATGFVGTNLVRKLLDQGDLVAGTYVSDDSLWRSPKHENMVSIECDLRRKDDIESMIENFKPDRIFHLATYGAYPARQKQVQKMYDVNVQGTLNLLEVIKDIPMINTGTSSEYGLKNKEMNEEDVCKPSSAYGVAKLAQTNYCQQSDKPTLRLFSAYGPFEDRGRLIPTLLMGKLIERDIHLINSVRDYCHVEDISDGFIRAYEKYDSIKGEVINISSGKETDVKELLKIINDFNDKKIKAHWDYEPVQIEPTHWVADTKKARRVLGWEAKIGLKQGLKQTYDWWKENLETNL